MRTAFRVAATIASKLALFVTLASKGMARPPAAVISSTAFWALSNLRSFTMTVAPSRARTLAIPSPIPRAAPVTIATLSVSSPMILSLSNFAGD